MAPSERHQFWPTFGNPPSSHPPPPPVRDTQSTPLYEQRAACVAAQEGRRVRVCEGAPVDRRKRGFPPSATNPPFSGLEEGAGCRSRPFGSTRACYPDPQAAMSSAAEAAAAVRLAQRAVRAHGPHCAHPAAAPHRYVLLDAPLSGVNKPAYRPLSAIPRQWP